MEKELLDALTAKFQGVSASILGRIAKKLAKTVTTAEQVKTAVEGLTLQQVIDSYTDSRVTEASETARNNAVKDYETRYGLKDGVKTTTSEGGASAATTNQGGDETSSLLKQLLERMDKMETSRTAETRTQQLNAVIGKLPEQMRKAYERLPVDKYTQGGVFGKPSANNGGSTKTELSDAQKAAISRREGSVTADGQPF